MNKINNERDYRIGYELLRILSKDGGKRVESYVAELKRNLRQYAAESLLSMSGWDLRVNAES